MMAGLTWLLFELKTAVKAMTNFCSGNFPPDGDLGESAKLSTLIFVITY